MGKSALDTRALSFNTVTQTTGVSNEHHIYNFDVYPKAGLIDLRAYDNHCFTPLIFFVFNIIWLGTISLEHSSFMRNVDGTRGRHQKCVL